MEFSSTTSNVIQSGSQLTSLRHFINLHQLSRGKSEDPWKKNLEILQKIAWFYFFPDQSRPLFQGLLPFPNGGQTRSKTISYWKQAQITARYKKKYSVFYHLMALTIPFLLKNLIYFISETFFPKTHEIGTLVMRPRKWQIIVRLTAEPWELAGLHQVNTDIKLTYHLII